MGEEGRERWTHDDWSSAAPENLAKSRSAKRKSSSTSTVISCSRIDAYLK